MIDISSLVPLQDLDLAIGKIDAKARQQEEKVAKLEGEIAKESALVEKKEALLKKIQLRKRDLEGKSASATDRIRSGELKLKSSGLSPNSYLALEKEIATARDENSDLETKILEDMEKVEVLQQDIEKSRKVVAGRKVQLEEFRKKIADQKGEIEREKDLLRTQRNQASLKIDSKILEVYETLRCKSKGQVIWFAETPGCPSCGFSFPKGFTTMLVGLKNEAEHCPNCSMLIKWVGIRDGVF